MNNVTNCSLNFVQYYGRDKIISDIKFKFKLNMAIMENFSFTSIVFISFNEFNSSAKKATLVKNKIFNQNIIPTFSNVLFCCF